MHIDEDSWSDVISFIDLSDNSSNPLTARKDFVIYRIKMFPILLSRLKTTSVLKKRESETCHKVNILIFYSKKILTET